MGEAENQQVNEEHPPAAAARRRRLSRAHQIEVLTVLLLSLASLAATWSGFQGSSWNGEQTELYTQAATARTESSRLNVVATQLELVDLETFNVYAVAVASGDTALADFHRRRFRPDFKPAFEAWIALDPLNNPDAPPSPFLMPEYQLPELLASEAKAEESATYFQQGTDAGENGDAYILTTVFLGIALFFLGISAQIDFLPARLTLIVFGAAMLAFSAYKLVTLPIA